MAGNPKQLAPRPDYLSAASVLSAAGLPTTEARHGALVALRDMAPEHCEPAAIRTELDRHFLDALIAAHQREMDLSRHRAQAVADEADRQALANVQLRHELAQVAAAQRWLVDHIESVARTLAGASAHSEALAASRDPMHRHAYARGVLEGITKDQADELRVITRVLSGAKEAA